MLVDALAGNGTAGSRHEAGHVRAATTSTLALLQAFRTFGIHCIGLVTPYTADVVTAIVASYARDGIAARTGEHPGISDNAVLADVAAAELTQLITRAAQGAEAVAAMCADLRAVALVEAEPTGAHRSENDSPGGRGG